MTLRADAGSGRDGRGAAGSRTDAAPIARRPGSGDAQRPDHGDSFPWLDSKAFAADPAGKPEKKDVSIGFIPITCGTPIIMAEPLGFYKKHGLNASVKASGGGHDP